jgi:pimeloyl-ACP methyl ester carboxylesterase
MNSSFLGRRPRPTWQLLVATAWQSALLIGAIGMLSAALAAPAGPPSLTLSACRLKGVSHEARCGVLRRALDPARPDGPQIDLHVAVLPALARNKLPDPVFFFAGGPGQSAISLAGPVSSMMGRFLNRRDLVLIDQRGTGDSAPLTCDAENTPTRSLREAIEPGREIAQLKTCRERLQQLPYGDLRFFTTVLASADAEAVRQALGLGPVNVVGGSYGTRAVLDYLRQYPGSVRRAVIDGVAPPDMVLMRSLGVDAQLALDRLVDDCEKTPSCHQPYPQLRAQLAALWASLPREVTVDHPVTGVRETVTLSRDALASMLRQPLYVPALASALPAAIDAASQGRFNPLFTLATGLSSPGKGRGLAMGMHFSVVCAEDAPRLGAAGPAPTGEMGASAEQLYRQVCADWPRGGVPPAFYAMPPSPVPVLVMSGAIDPVTPPRHGEAAARALGPQAVHVVVPNAGHGVSSLGCLRDVVYRFVNQPDPARALAEVKADAACAGQVPRPPAFVPVHAPSASGVKP